MYYSQAKKKDLAPEPSPSPSSSPSSPAATPSPSPLLPLQTVKREHAVFGLLEGHCCGIPTSGSRPANDNCTFFVEEKLEKYLSQKIVENPNEAMAGVVKKAFNEIEEEFKDVARKNGWNDGCSGGFLRKKDYNM